MKQICKDIAISIAMGMLLPGFVLNLGLTILKEQPQRGDPEQAEIHGISQPRNIGMTMHLRAGTETVEEMDMDAYLVGVVLAEMPAAFEAEALKAQAVVARTYARKACETGGKHGDGSVCADPTCCQGYCKEDAYLASGGTWESVQKIRDAVFSTSGQVLTYEGDLIEATYFSCSGGSTEDAAAVWGRDFPYLQAVESPGEEEAAYYRDTVCYVPSELESLLGISLEDAPQDWIGEILYTEGGGVSTVAIGGQTFEGTELRSLLGLRSTAFSIQAQQDLITITTKGYGHRVGMSQYGADAMAIRGSDYRQILAHYYPGTELTELVE